MHIPIPELIGFLPAVRKRPEFRHKREIRLLGQLGERGLTKSPGGEGITAPYHHLVAVDFTQLFEAVYAGPNMGARRGGETHRIISRPRRRAGITAADRNFRAAWSTWVSSSRWTYRMDEFSKVPVWNSQGENVSSSR
jgi:hypothetical protein